MKILNLDPNFKHAQRVPHTTIYRRNGGQIPVQHTTEPRFPLITRPGQDPRYNPPALIVGSHYSKRDLICFVYEMGHKLENDRLEGPADFLELLDDENDAQMGAA